MSELSRLVTAAREAADGDYAATLAATVELFAEDAGIRLTPALACRLADAAVGAMAEEMGLAIARQAVAFRPEDN